MARRKMSEEEKKANLTININETLLERIDKLNKENGEKRSRLIEKLLEEYVEKNKDKLDESNI
jgi:metal-responsive CopG/Arc/MetJ family transcriptional regulator